MVVLVVVYSSDETMPSLIGAIKLTRSRSVVVVVVVVHDFPMTNLLRNGGCVGGDVRRQLAVKAATWLMRKLPWEDGGGFLSMSHSGHNHRHMHLKRQYPWLPPLTFWDKEECNCIRRGRGQAAPSKKRSSITRVHPPFQASRLISLG